MSEEGRYPAFARRLQGPIWKVCLFCCSVGGWALTSVAAQAAPEGGSAAVDTQRRAEIDHRLNDIAAALRQTQRALEESLTEVQSLRAELNGVRDKDVAAKTALTQGVDADRVLSDKEDGSIAAIHDEQEALQAEIKQHEQTKVETESKYPLRVTGLVLFNGFANSGIVDNAQLPSFALPRSWGSSDGSTGATLRQTILGLHATGPLIAGARTSADVSMDFFGGASSSSSGYGSSGGYGSAAGSVRMRLAQVNLDWKGTTLQAGVMGPLISPLSPTSYATVAQPALSGSGNLWTWSPQVRVEERFRISGENVVALEGGVIDPQSPSYTSSQGLSPVEASRRPGVEGRLSFRRADAPRASGQSLVMGIGGYSSNQLYNSSAHVHGWAVTGDWQIPVGPRVQLSGEIYRGSAIGGLGGGVYKDVLSGVDARSGMPRIDGVDTAGGWSQLKVRFARIGEANAMYGVDDALSSNFERLVLYPSMNPLQLYARNSSVVGNVIFRPKTYLIFSPEYRRLLSVRYGMPADVAHVFTITAGYQF